MIRTLAHLHLNNDIELESQHQALARTDVLKLQLVTKATGIPFDDYIELYFHHIDEEGDRATVAAMDSLINAAVALRHDALARLAAPVK